MDLQNQDSRIVSVDPAGLRIFDSQGMQLPTYDTSYETTKRTDSQSNTSKTVESGESLRISDESFVVNPNSNSLNTLFVTHLGVKRNGIQIPIRFRLKRM